VEGWITAVASASIAAGTSSPSGNKVINALEISLPYASLATAWTSRFASIKAGAV
jgi:hypothetical protein